MSAGLSKKKSKKAAVPALHNHQPFLIPSFYNLEPLTPATLPFEHPCQLPSDPLPNRQCLDLGRDDDLRRLAVRCFGKCSKLLSCSTALSAPASLMKRSPSASAFWTLRIASASPSASRIIFSFCASARRIAASFSASASRIADSFLPFGYQDRRFLLAFGTENGLTALTLCFICFSIAS